jgi:glycosyltransferase involved in cell wall biosynthesis
MSPFAQSVYLKAGNRSLSFIPVPTNRLYYGLKPYLPWRLRMALRRIIARWKRKAYQDVWPIKESAGSPSAGWPGWPDGKKFALVLTHDVEGSRGLAKCRQLMELEMQMGVRSSFNFIPESEYKVSRELREELQENGFEVGIQDLKHDGKLFQSREAFKQGAAQINRYVHEWGVAGFRSGFMFHNMEWVHDLDIDYSSCTFDTDPFEPQPDDVGTIFPFWVPRATVNGERTNGVYGSKFDLSSPAPSSLTSTYNQSRGGYVEIPYTLPQDSTLFLLLQERGPDIWLNKLDWIVKCGGMVLLNTHPDYMAMNGNEVLPDEYPVDFYKQFLNYVRSKYAGQYWQVLPREVAACVYSSENVSMTKAGNGDGAECHARVLRNKLAPTSASGESPVSASVPDVVHNVSARLDQINERKIELDDSSFNGGHLFQGRRAAVVLFSEYPADPRPRRAAEALAREGMVVDVICLQGNAEESKRECIDGINVFRIPLKRCRGNKLGYIFQYGVFILASFAFLSRRLFPRRYDLVHVHNMPDVLVFSALVPKLLGAKVILDLHDPMPELMMTIFGMRKDSPAVRLLKVAEKCSVRFADRVLTVNEASKRIYASRSCAPEKVQIVMNSPNEQVFQFQPVCSQKLEKKGAKEPFVLMYHGSIFQRNGLDLAVEALEAARRSIPNARLTISGENNSFLEQVMRSVKGRGLEEAVSYLGRQNQRQIAEAIDKCDIGIIPNRRNIFTEMNTPTRIFEYLARGKAVIAPRAQGIQDYFGPEDILFFELGNASDLARQIEYAFFHPDEVEEIVRRGQEVYLAHRWSRERAGFVNAVVELSGGRHKAR